MPKIFVEAHPQLEDGRTAFWEVHPDHPKNGKQGPGEVYITAGSPDGPFRLEQTPLVNEAIAQQRLVQASRRRSSAEAEPESTDDDEDGDEE